MFDNKNFGVIAYANGFTYWVYRTDDTINDVKESNYFPKNTIDLLAIGDIITIIARETTDTLYIKSLNPVVLAKQGE